ncbi:hypothetical protein NP493_319g04005 [Ridgeia piscesae]|uniref:Methionine--tRNA ligase, mitochondrial n=1 Tax=Ridgeia piscesae TaxID=27915 RepID=A0AAD9L4R7_RIDPI|nr:hypothetical protein NP493_319g04005 [Ridgeia piscesae]
MLEERGHIYKGSYEGWYSVSDEAFLTEDEVTDGTDKQGQTCKVSSESGQPVEWLKEENYMFRLSQFGPQLTEWLNKTVFVAEQDWSVSGSVQSLWLNKTGQCPAVSSLCDSTRQVSVQQCPVFVANKTRSVSSSVHSLWRNKTVITPTNFEPAVRRWIADGLPDLSISRQRERLQWGIQVPGDDSQTMYVWLDALTNYLTVGGFPESGHLWPADCHVIGKDILRFHAIYWPAFLMAAGLEPPRKILCHSHWTIDGVKMSKSRGNVVDPFDRLQKYSSDAVRYFLLREGVPHSDGRGYVPLTLALRDLPPLVEMDGYSDQRLVDCVNSELANTLGNLLSRCSACSLNRDQVFPDWLPQVFADRCDDDDQEMWRRLASLPGVVDCHYRDFNVYKALDAIMSQLRHTNAFVQKHEPWCLKDIPEERPWLDTILHVAMENVRVSAILLQPVVPKMASDTLDRLNVSGEERYWGNLPHRTERVPLGTDTGALFSRIKMKAC